MAYHIRALSLIAASILPAIAAAQSTTDQLVQRLDSEGFSRIEITEGLTQTKVEAIRGTEKLEFVYDNATGRILKEERELADADEIGLTGIETRSRARDFVDGDRVAGLDDDDDDDRGRGRGHDDDDDHDEDDHGGHDDDHDDDDDDSDDD